VRGLPTDPVAALLPNPLQGLIEGNDIFYSFKGQKIIRDDGYNDSLSDNSLEERGLICERFSEMQWSEAEHERSEYGTYNLSALGLLS